jgi:response regulator RpfG family c-di-GMP phosphodiesterase
MARNLGRILVIDDDEAFGSMVADVLSQKGHEVVRHTDPLVALESVQKGPFAAAVVDLVMPAMGGLELADQIKARSPDTQVVILTGQADVGSAIESIQRGVFDFLRKDSLELPVLERTIGKAVERSDLIRQNRELLAQLSESNHHLLALHELGTVLAGEPHLDLLLGKLVRAAKQISKAETGRVILLGATPNSGFVIQLSVGDQAATIQGARLQPSEGLAALAIETGEAINLPWAADHPRFSPRCDEMPTRLPGFLCAPLSHGSVRGALMVAGRSSGGFSPQDQDALKSLGRQAAVAIENARAHERSLNFFTHISEILVSVLESMDIFYKGHSRRVAALADTISRRVGLGDTERRDIHFGALLHDIGKIQLDHAVLSSTGMASKAVLQHMRAHPTLGLEILRPITILEGILPTIHGHHERWDGAGYPLGVRGELIPLGARIVAIADSFDAMTWSTPYKVGRTIDDALAEMEACSGSQFDPTLTTVFVTALREHGRPT